MEERVGMLAQFSANGNGTGGIQPWQSPWIMTEDPPEKGERAGEKEQVAWGRLLAGHRYPRPLDPPASEGGLHLLQVPDVEGDLLLLPLLLEELLGLNFNLNGSLSQVQ